MNSIENYSEFEYTQQPAVVVPANEFLQDRWLATEAWPDLCMSNPSFLAQIERHMEFIGEANQVFEALAPSIMTLETATLEGVITDKQTEDLYLGLSELLSDEDAFRLVLYLPFEFLPAADWLPENDDLRGAIENFKNTYLNAWLNMLSAHDVRANFVDGNVLEPELRDGDLPRIVKATQFIPQLVSLGMISQDEVIEIATNSDDQLLKDNINEALVALDYTSTEHNISKQDVVTSMDSILGQLEETINQEFVDEKNITQRRRSWLEQKTHEKKVQDLAAQVCELILQNDVSADELAVGMVSHGAAGTESYVEGVLKAIEEIALKSIEDAKLLYLSHSDRWLQLWGEQDTKSRDTIAKAYRHLYRLDLINDHQLDSLGIKLPRLNGPLSENLELMQAELEKLKSIAGLIEQNAELSTLVYPVVTLGGSRLKGYGQENADVDVGVFMRPTTTNADKQHARQLLYSIFGNDEVIELWLKEEDDKLFIYSPQHADAHQGDKYWTHMLFNTAWVGDPIAIEDLRKRLLTSYFYETGEQFDRSLYLERIEQDLLQYRLMHKGYERHYPSQVKSRYSHLPDNNSTFWDSGYRLMATRLFINSVFLPRLSEPK